MADVQKENGYTAIAHELLEAICNSGFTAMELKIILTIARHTYGFHKTEAEISLGTIANFTKHKDRAGISKAVTRLIHMNVVQLTGMNGQTRILKLNKDYDTWNVSGCRNDNSFQNDNSCQNDNKTIVKSTTQPLSKQQHILYKDIIKDIKDNIYAECSENGNSFQNDNSCQNDNSKHEDFEEDFEKLWAMYPRKRGKNKVTKKAKKELEKAGFETVARAISNYKSEIKKNRTNEKYIMYGSTFFNGGWRDFEREVTPDAGNEPKFKPSTGFRNWEQE